MYEVFRYKKREIKYVKLELFDDKTVGKATEWENSEQIYFGKTAYVRDWNDPNSVDYEDSYGPKRSLQSKRSTIPDMHAGITLYVAPECKISRDVLRNDGYSITYNKANSDYRILPSIPTNAVKQKCQIVFVLKNQLHICWVERSVGEPINNTSYYAETYATATEVETVLSFLENKYAVNRTDMMYRRDKPLKNMNVWFLTVCEDTQYYLTHVCRLNEKFCFDTDVPLKGSTNITPENLLLWSKVQDTNLLEKALLNSDWKKYPVTVCVFLAREKSSEAGRFSPAGKVMLKAINFDQLNRYSGSLGGQVVTADDWNMLQDYITLRLGITEKSGLVEDIYPYSDYIRHRYAIAQWRISGNKTFSNIMDELDSTR